MSEVRVRFAPSPTGFVHVGSLRTALYNYLFAKNHNGKFILRIEDTDQNRYVEGAVDNLLETLKWAGLEYDEGPEKSGDYGPYYQSQRQDIYKEHVNNLLETDHAYPCFCTSEHLEKMREKQIAGNLPPKYDGTCRSIEKTEAQKRMRSEPYVIRLKVPEEGETVVNDIVRGEVTFQSNLLDDQVLIKSDGFPTYHMANVVDDHLMKITHVIRGEEWLPSTPKHIILYQAFGWEAPQFAHLPLLLNADRSKLSKRQGDVAVEDYRDKGILHQALINFVALLGWHKGEGNEQEIFSLKELIEHFSLDRVNKAGAVFDMGKLDWLNGMYIRSIPENEYLDEGFKWLKKELLDTGDSDKNRDILLAVRDSLNKFSELKDKSKLFFAESIESYSDSAKEWIMLPESRNIFIEMLKLLDSYKELNLDNFRVLMKDVQKSTGVKGKNLWMPVRSAITGLTEGPELPAVISVFGIDKVKRLLQQAIKN
ncbi:MAG: glutamate--tRNA ligase [Calditrichaceae bacterium]